MSEFNRRQYYKRKSIIIKMKRKIANAKKRIRRFRMLLRVSLIFGLVYLSYQLLGLSAWYINPADVVSLKPDVIRIEGNLITPEYKIADIIRREDAPNEQIYKYSTKNLEESLMRLQSVKKAYIRRFWFPARIIVFIEERTPVFLIAPNDESAPISAITEDGYYIDREYMPIPSKFKTTKILSYGTNDDDYENWDKKRVDELIKLTKTIEAYSKQKVIYIDLRNQNDIYVKLDDVMLRIGSIDDTLKDRIKSIPTILPEAKTLKQKVKYIDLRWKNTNYIKLDTEKPEQKQDKKDKNKEKNKEETPD